MTTLKTTTLLTLLTAFSVACQREEFEYTMEKPASIAALEPINKYAALKTYVDPTANPGFKLGAGVSLSGYTAKGLMYR